MSLTSLSRLGSLLTVVLAGRRSSLNAVLIQNLVSRIVVIIALAVLAALMAAILLGVGLYAGYSALVAGGLDAQSALLVVGMSLLVLILLLVMLICRSIQALKRMPADIIESEAPFISGVSGIAGAFVDGLLGAGAGKGSPGKGEGK